MASKFAAAHGDILSVMMIGGLPWPESLEGHAFSRDVEDNLSRRPASGQKLFVSISPLNSDRSGIAPYWGEHDNQPLPDDWRNAKLNDPRVERAFSNFCRTVVNRMHPDYLAIGIEDNVLLSKDATAWSQLKELHRKTYRALKAEFPALPVFFTTDIGHYLGYATESKGLPEKAEVEDLMRDSDMFAMSYYPYMHLNLTSGTEDGFLSFATGFHKPIAVSESGMTSKDVLLKSRGITLRGTQEDQNRFVQFLLQTAARDRYQFVVQFATTDFEKLTARLPEPTAEIAGIWQFTGMQRSDGSPKPALAIWDQYLKLPFKR